MQETSPGCFGFLILILLGIVGTSFFVVQRSEFVAPEAVVVTVDAPDIVVITPTAASVPDVAQVEIAFQPAPEFDYSAEDITQTVTIIESLLGSLELSTYEVIETVDEDGAPLIVVRVAGDDPTIPATVIEAVTLEGLLEFVDFTGIINPETYEGFFVLTDVQIARYGDRIDNGTRLKNTDDVPFTTILNSSDVVSAEAQQSEFGDWTLIVTFTDEAGERFAEYTEANIGQPLAIVLNGEVLSVPIIQAPLSNSALITGNFTEDEARLLATQLNSDPIPVPLVVVSTRIISD